MKNINYLCSLLGTKKTKKGYMDAKGILHATVKEAGAANLALMLYNELGYKIQSEKDQIDALIQFITNNTYKIHDFIKGFNIIEKNLLENEK